MNESRLEKDSPNVSIRQAIGSDARLLFEWRNETTARKNSRNSEVIEWEAHRAWFDRALANPQRSLLIVSCGGAPAGTIRFDLTAVDCEISIVISAEFRGQGLATKSLVLAETFLAEHHREIHTILAWIADDNAASQRTFQALGYVSTERTDGRFRQYAKKLTD